MRLIVEDSTYQSHLSGGIFTQLPFRNCLCHSSLKYRGFPAPLPLFVYLPLYGRKPFANWRQHMWLKDKAIGLPIRCHGIEEANLSVAQGTTLSDFFQLNNRDVVHSAPLGLQTVQSDECYFFGGRGCLFTTLAKAASKPFPVSETPTLRAASTNRSICGFSPFFGGFFFGISHQRPCR